MSDNVEKVFFGGTPFPKIGEMADEIWAVIMDYENDMPLMAAVGVLRLMEHKLLSEVHNYEAD